MEKPASQIEKVNKISGGYLLAVYRFISEKPLRTLTYLFILSTIIFLASIPLNRGKGLLIGSDGIWYYMYTRSLVIDHDIDFANEHHYLSSKDPSTLGMMSETQTGYISNKYSIGPGILWMPFFLIVHGISLMMRNFGIPVNIDGYSYFYQAAICLGSITYGYLGIILSFLTSKRFFPKTALFSCLLLWFASSGIHYQIVQPSMSHMSSFFSVSLLIYIWIKNRPFQTLHNWLLIGLAGGLVGLVRQPDITFLLLPILDCIFDQTKPVIFKIKALSTVGFGFMAIFSIQMVTWMILFGSPLSNGYMSNGEGFFWFSPQVFEVLFSTNHGLYLWHPILLFATIGLFLFKQFDRKLSILISLGFVLQIYLIAAWYCWYQGDSFGGRMFIASYPVLIIGLSCFLSWAISKGFSKLVWIISCILIVWNGLFLVQYIFHYIPHQGFLSFDQIFTGKFRMVSGIFQKAIIHFKY